VSRTPFDVRQSPLSFAGNRSSEGVTVAGDASLLCSVTAFRQPLRLCGMRSRALAHIVDAVAGEWIRATSSLPGDRVGCMVRDASQPAGPRYVADILNSMVEEPAWGGRRIPPCNRQAPDWRWHYLRTEESGGTSRRTLWVSLGGTLHHDW
jgi:hypothetical protein